MPYRRSGRRRRRPRTVVAWVAGALVLVVLLGIGAWQVVRMVEESREPEPIDVTGGTGPGSVIRAETLPTLPRTLSSEGVEAAKVVYRSAGAEAGLVPVTGVVVKPGGAPPDGGWPVVSVAHGSLGIQPECAPSSDPATLGKQWQLVEILVDRGYAVTLTDYAGLGVKGEPHPYLDNAVAGRNVIDAVRAARRVYPDLGKRWAAVGGSQGGGAAWGANEQAPSYAPELPPVGVVAMVPAADMRGLVAAAADGTMTRDQLPLLQWLLASLGRTHPDLDLDDYRRGATKADWDLLAECSEESRRDRLAAMGRMGDREMAPESPRARQRLEELVGGLAVRGGPTAAPMLVVLGDADSIIPMAWTQPVVAAARARGADIEVDLQEGAGHATVDPASALSWLYEHLPAR
ncbi:lipase family protein [Nocardioides sp. SYSU D00038]|uniref:lipase family protein n=1 Tax=Nocardioides sp. SYSU D00038 TaxID=2812554 RepID=UPI001968309C|nr:lipase family protein [Nocardioides sp. SYSU D00038]